MAKSDPNFVLQEINNLISPQEEDTRARLIIIENVKSLIINYSVKVA